MKKYLSILLVIVLGLTLTACTTKEDPNAKKFEETDFEITLNKDFEKSTISGIKYYYKNETMESAVVVKVESKTMFENAGIEFPDDVKSYADFIVSTNSLKDSKVEMVGKTARFDYKKTVNGHEYYYYAVAQKNGDDYWLVTFYCYSEKANEYNSEFVKWAKTITVK